MDYAIFALLSYVLGSVPFGVLVARLHGIDLMAVGSGNTGATNVTRALGWKLGLVVFVLDVAKGAAPPVVA
ncbi:MAG: glycerol-3-phosphate acyltransferase, partial [Fimbriimonadaceae bacterium]